MKVIFSLQDSRGNIIDTGYSTLDGKSIFAHDLNKAAQAYFAILVRNRDLPMSKLTQVTTIRSYICMAETKVQS